jgi:hypothetical protein
MPSQVHVVPTVVFGSHDFASRHFYTHDKAFGACARRYPHQGCHLRVEVEPEPHRLLDNPRAALEWVAERPTVSFPLSAPALPAGSLP